MKRPKTGRGLKNYYMNLFEKVWLKDNLQLAAEMLTCVITPITKTLKDRRAGVKRAKKYLLKAEKFVMVK